MKRILPVAVLVGVAAVGIAMTLFVNAAAHRASQSRFELVATEAANRLAQRIDQHILLLKVTAADMMTSTRPLDRSDYKSFFEAVDVPNNYPGVLGIGFALITDKGKEKLAEDLLKINYGINRQIWPEQGKVFRTPIVLLEPQNERNAAAMGFDMFSQDNRAETMRHAMTAFEPTASPPVELVQEIKAESKQAGVLVYVPVKLAAIAGQYSSETLAQGFVYAPFRAGDLHTAAWSGADLQAAYQTVDLASGGKILAQSEDYVRLARTSALHSTQQITVAGRVWEIDFVANGSFQSGNWQLGTLLLGIVSLLLAAALAVSARSQMLSLETAEKLAVVSQQASSEKDLMLQEMKHRIKNSIARVLAIARQTSSSSSSMEEFNKSFFARLQSMASAQELLTRSQWEKAELRTLVCSELEQVLGDGFAASRVSGPAVLLNERATQALGLTFHEMATNALKYGDLEGIQNGLGVNWQIIKTSGESRLVLEWLEPETSWKPDQKNGFGSRLMTMSIERELGGTIEKSTDGSGLVIKLTMPLRLVT
jgi:CHASE1-domain containing sensor protein